MEIGLSREKAGLPSSLGMAVISNALLGIEASGSGYFTDNY